MARVDDVMQGKYSFPSIPSNVAIDWAKATLKTLKSRSPLSMKVRSDKVPSLNTINLCDLDCF